MSLATDIARDWQFIDGVESVTVTAVSRQSQSDVTCASTQALQRQVTTRHLSVFGGLGLEPGSVLWEVWNARASGSDSVLTTLGRDLRQSDTLTTASSVVWRVNQVVWSPLTGRWQCLCTKAVE